MPFSGCFELIHRELCSESYSGVKAKRTDLVNHTFCSVLCDSVRSFDQLKTPQKRQEKLWRLRTFFVPGAQDYDRGSGDECQNSLKCSRGPLGLRIPHSLWLLLARCDFDLSINQLNTWQKRHVELSRFRIFFGRNSSGVRPGRPKAGL